MHRVSSEPLINYTIDLNPIIVNRLNLGAAFSGHSSTEATGESLAGRSTSEHLLQVHGNPSEHGHLRADREDHDVRGEYATNDLP